MRKIELEGCMKIREVNSVKEELTFFLLSVKQVMFLVSMKIIFIYDLIYWDRDW